MVCRPAIKDSPHPFWVGNPETTIKEKTAVLPFRHRPFRNQDCHPGRKETGAELPFEVRGHHVARTGGNPHNLFRRGQTPRPIRKGLPKIRRQKNTGVEMTSLFRKP